MENATDEKHVQDPNVREARQHYHAARNELRKSMEAWLPPGVLEHRRAARREFLLAMRSMVNAALDHLERIDEEEPPQQA